MQSLWPRVAEWLSTSNLFHLSLCNTFLLSQLLPLVYQHPQLFSPSSLCQLLQVISKNPCRGKWIKSLRLFGRSVDDCLLGDIDQLLSLAPNLERFALENGIHLTSLLVKSLSQHGRELREVFEEIFISRFLSQVVPSLTSLSRS